MTAFATLPLKPALVASVDGLGYAQMTPIQAQSLPPMLDGRDVIAQARTGSGKTAAFGLALLQKLDVETIRLQALVLCPTRELADQVSKTLRRLAVAIPNIKLLTLCGGMPLGPQLASLTHDPHIVVGTPGRVQEHLKRGSLHGGGIQTLVLDEADRMLDMGFAEAIDDIVGRIAKHHQTLLFSATYPEAIRTVSARLQRDPIAVTADAAPEASTIEQRFYEVDPARKLDALSQLLRDNHAEAALVFCNMRRDVDAVAIELDRRGFSALALHGDMEQRDRDEVLVRFANRSCNVLVATDVAARGLDIAELPLVISYDLAHDADTHTHRIGRTGRAGHHGRAITLCSARERPKAAALLESAQAPPLPWQLLKPAAAGGKSLHLAPMQTLAIDAGRQDKLRPGDILGALTGAAGLDASAIGKIDIYATRAYVAIRREQAAKALQGLRAGRIKGRNFRVRSIG